jgi:hypothetical protein
MRVILQLKFYITGLDDLYEDTLMVCLGMVCSNF